MCAVVAWVLGLTPANRFWPAQNAFKDLPMNNVDIKAAEPDRVSASYMLLMKSNRQIAIQPLSRADAILIFFLLALFTSQEFWGQAPHSMEFSCDKMGGCAPEVNVFDELPTTEVRITRPPLGPTQSPCCFPEMFFPSKAMFHINIFFASFHFSFPTVD
jgi:hypothetical protein